MAHSRTRTTPSRCSSSGSARLADLSHTPLSQVSFAWEQPRRFQDGPGSGGGPAALNLTTVHIGQGGAPVDLMMQVGDADGEFTCVLQYNTDLFDDATIEGVARHFVTLLHGIVADPDSRVSELPLLTDPERRELAGWNDTWVGYDAAECIHDMVAATSRRSPDAIAVWFEAHDGTYRELTYAELDRRADELAHRLQGLGVGAGSIVAVLLDRCDDLVVALLGVLKAGGAFMPIDPAQPTNRIASVLAGAPEVEVCLTHHRHLQHLHEFAGHRLSLDQQTDPTGRDAAPAVADVTSSSPAYVVFTSGSTGAPKGAVNTHGGLRNYLLWMADTYRVTSDDRVLHHTPVTFDASLAEIFLPLVLGARLVIARPEGHKDVGYLVRTIAEQSVTQVVHVVPSILRAMLAEPAITQCAALRRVSCGGEVLPYEVVQRFWATLDAELWNEYGPAEAAITTTAFHCERAASGPPVPIGRPIANVTTHIVDAHQRPVPVGVPGELLIGGAGVGRGYLNQPDATAARFIAAPFAADPDRLLYRTGDLARYLPNGTIEYLGRLDDQVEIHGVRIEPSEVEAALDKHPGVRESAVVAGTDGRGNTRLVAHFVGLGEPAPSTAELRRFLLDWLPAAMVPAALHTHGGPATHVGREGGPSSFGGGRRHLAGAGIGLRGSADARRADPRRDLARGARGRPGRCPRRLLRTRWFLDSEPADLDARQRRRPAAAAGVDVPVRHHRRAGRRIRPAWPSAQRGGSGTRLLRLPTSMAIRSSSPALPTTSSPRPVLRCPATLAASSRETR